MKYLKKTENYFYGVLEPGELLPRGRTPMGVQVKTDPASGETRVRFPCDRFTDWDDCQRRAKSGDGASRLRKTVRVHTKSVTINDADWEAMQAYMVNPAGFKREDFRVYEAWLCHNIVDRDGERFSIDVLRAFESTLPGKAVLTGHDWNGMGEGRFFRARLEKTDTDAMLKMTGERSLLNDDGALKRIESTDGGLYWLVAGYYVLADDEAKIRKIDSGIISDMSIGFRAPELVPVKGEQDDILWWEYRNTESRQAEALEGSHVFLGAQYGARTRKDVSGPRDNAPDADNGHTQQVEETLKLACLCGEVPFEENAVKSARQELFALSPENLTGRQAAYREKLDARRAYGDLLADNTTGLEKSGLKTTPAPDARHFRAPAGIKMTTQQGGIQ